MWNEALRPLVTVNVDEFEAEEEAGKRRQALVGLGLMLLIPASCVLSRVPDSLREPAAAVPIGLFLVWFLWMILTREEHLRSIVAGLLQLILAALLTAGAWMTVRGVWL